MRKHRERTGEREDLVRVGGAAERMGKQGIDETRDIEKVIRQGAGILDFGELVVGGDVRVQGIILFVCQCLSVRRGRYGWLRTRHFARRTLKPHATIAEGAELVGGGAGVAVAFKHGIDLELVISFARLETVGVRTEDIEHRAVPSRRGRAVILTRAFPVFVVAELDALPSVTGEKRGKIAAGVVVVPRGERSAEC